MEDRRLNKYLADSGHCSRREADRLIGAGRVTIDGEIAPLGARVGPGAKVAVDGKPLDGAGEKVYLALNKPRGVVCTTAAREPMNIVEYLDYPTRVYPVGRLDKDSEGLILLTSDGDIVNRLLRASGGHEKEYEVKVDKPVTREFLEKMRAGVPILDRTTLPCRAWRTGPNSFTIILAQGMNRQIRRMCEALGYRVTALRRTRIMHIRLDGLKSGQWRKLTDAELKGLMKSLSDTDK